MSNPAALDCSGIVICTMRILHTMLRVGDLDATIEFYSKHFGMTVWPLSLLEFASAPLPGAFYLNDTLVCFFHASHS
jgi:catechol 2,3-dioxygenase-like lactoylglutathione lyase family enzyme